MFKRARRTLGLFLGGLLFGAVAAAIAYQLVKSMVCVPSFPDTCFVTQYGEFRPLIYIFSFAVPAGMAVAFTMLQGTERQERLAYIVMSVVAGLLVLLMVLRELTPRTYTEVGKLPNNSLKSDAAKPRTLG